VPTASEAPPWTMQAMPWGCGASGLSLSLPSARYGTFRSEKFPRDWLFLDSRTSFLEISLDIPVLGRLVYVLELLGDLP